MRFETGNIFTCDAEALVNTVNTVGVMGKGLALQFKEHFPDNYKLYQAACKRDDIVVGKMFITPTNSMVSPKWIINFPTKKHWMHKSSYSYIEAGLDDLVEQIGRLKIQSIAIPPLGAGQGGLDWGLVKQIIIKKLDRLPIEITVFEPTVIIQTNYIGKQTRLTKSRAMVLSLIAQYKKLGYDISLLEIQKLAYFLQRMGQSDLKLNYKQYLYGPYAHNLQHLLHELEKGYISSEKPILDSNPLDLIRLNNETIEEVFQFIENECTLAEKTRLEKVFCLMAGYESPFGLELLATVDWILHTCKVNLTEMEVKDQIKIWSKRKDNNFNIKHVQSAQIRLIQFRSELAYSS